MTDDEVREFLQAYGVGASKALGLSPNRLHVKGGEGKEGVIVALTIDGVAATEDQLRAIKNYLEKAIAN